MQTGFHWKIGISPYKNGCRRCSQCEVYFSGLPQDTTQCPCCGQRLRFKPANRKASERSRAYQYKISNEFKRLGWISGTRIRSAKTRPTKASRILAIQKNL